MMSAYFVDLYGNKKESSIHRITRSELVFTNNGRIHLILDREEDTLRPSNNMDKVEVYCKSVHALKNFINKHPNIKETLRVLADERQFDGVLIDVIKDALWQSDGYR